MVTVPAVRHPAPCHPDGRGGPYAGDPGNTQSNHGDRAMTEQQPPHARWDSRHIKEVIRMTDRANADALEAAFALTSAGVNISDRAESMAGLSRQVISSLQDICEVTGSASPDRAKAG